MRRNNEEYDDVGGDEAIVGMTKDSVFDNYHEWAVNNGYAKTMVTSGTMSAQLKTFRGLTLTGFAKIHKGSRTVKARVFEKTGNGR